MLRPDILPVSLFNPRFRSRPFLLFCCLIWVGIGFFGCQNEVSLRMYADPWLEGFATLAKEKFEHENPGVKLEFRFLSSEVIAQRIHFDEPMDLALVLDQTLLAEKKLNSRIEESISLAKTHLVLARRKGDLKERIPGAGGTALPASDRPLRRVADEWVATRPDLIRERPLRYANFYDQSRDYLLRGWVREGFVLETLVLQHPNLLEVRERGPEMPGGVQLLVLNGGLNPAWAQKFAEFLQSEKTAELLAACHFIP